MALRAPGLAAPEEPPQRLRLPDLAMPTVLPRKARGPSIDSARGPGSRGDPRSRRGNDARCPVPRKHRQHHRSRTIPRQRLGPPRNSRAGWQPQGPACRRGWRTSRSSRFNAPCAGIRMKMHPIRRESSAGMLPVLPWSGVGVRRCDSARAARRLPDSARFAPAPERKPRGRRADTPSAFSHGPSGSWPKVAFSSASSRWRATSR